MVWASAFTPAVVVVDAELCCEPAPDDLVWRLVAMLEVDEATVWRLEVDVCGPVVGANGLDI